MVNIAINQGEDKQFSLTFTDNDSNPIDLSIYTKVLLSISASPDLDTENIKLDLDNGISVNDNIISFSIDSDSTFNLYQKDYWGDLMVFDGDTFKKLISFKFTVDLSSNKNFPKASI
jgi:hypothetical protein